MKTAYKHGIRSQDIQHAVEHPIIVHLLDGYQIVIGPDRAGQLLEIGINRLGQAFHAMPARSKYLRQK